MKSKYLSYLVLFLIFSCAPSTFLISKSGHTYYLGRDDKTLRAMLCDSGDLKAILAEADIPDDIKKDLMAYNCTDQHSGQMVISTYLLLSPDEKETLKSAFIRHGYTVNSMACSCK